MEEYKLTKSQRKIAREIIEKGLDREFADGLRKLDEIIARWKKKELSDREAWYEVFGWVNDHDKHIAYRYDALRPRDFLYTIAAP